MKLVTQLRCLLLFCICITVLVLLIYYLTTQKVSTLLHLYSAMSFLQPTTTNDGYHAVRTPNTQSSSFSRKFYTLADTFQTSPQNQSYSNFQSKSNSSKHVEWKREHENTLQKEQAGGSKKSQDFQKALDYRQSSYVDGDFKTRGANWEKSIAWKGNKNMHEANFLFERFFKGKNSGQENLKKNLSTNILMNANLGLQSKPYRDSSLSQLGQGKHQPKSSFSPKLAISDRVGHLRNKSSHYISNNTHNQVKSSSHTMKSNENHLSTKNSSQFDANHDQHLSGQQLLVHQKQINYSSHDHIAYPMNKTIMHSVKPALQNLFNSFRHSVLPLSYHEKTDNLSHLLGSPKSAPQLKNANILMPSELEVFPTKWLGSKRQGAEILVHGKKSHQNTSQSTYQVSKSLPQILSHKAKLIKSSKYKTEVRNLSQFSEKLYSKAQSILKGHQCSSHQLSRQFPVGITTQVKTVKYKELVLCSRSNMSDVAPLVVMVTSMYHNEAKQFIFSNTIRNWPKMSPQLLPVLYLSDRKVVHRSGGLIYEACSHGWTVAFVPQCNKHGTPLFQSMLDHSKLMWPESKYHGFCNGDILLNPDLVQTIRFLSKDDIKPVMMVSRRRNAYLKAGQVIKDQVEIERLQAMSELHPITGIDLFVLQLRKFPLHKVPPLVIGRPAYDNWLVSFTTTSGLQAVDITETVTCVHQALTGHNSPTNPQDLQHNFKYVSQSFLKRGFIDCIVYYTHYVNPVKRANNDNTLSDIREIYVNPIHAIKDNTLSDNREINVNPIQHAINDNTLSDNREINMNPIQHAIKDNTPRDNGQLHLNPVQHAIIDNTPSNKREMHVALRLPDSFCLVKDSSQVKPHKRGLFLNANLVPWWESSHRPLQRKEPRLSLVVASALCVFSLILLGALSTLCLCPD